MEGTEAEFENRELEEAHRQQLRDKPLPHAPSTSAGSEYDMDREKERIAALYVEHANAFLAALDSMGGEFAQADLARYKAVADSIADVSSSALYIKLFGRDEDVERTDAFSGPGALSEREREKTMPPKKQNGQNARCADNSSS